MALIMKNLVLDGPVSSKSHARADVLRLQFALNTIATAWGGPKKSLPFDGQYTKQLTEAVKGFQIHCFSNSKKSTGEITPNDATHQKINQVPTCPFQVMDVLVTCTCQPLEWRKI